jgi:hypothetical protein
MDYQQVITVNGPGLTYKGKILKAEVLIFAVNKLFFSLHCINI